MPLINNSQSGSALQPINQRLWIYGPAVHNVAGMRWWSTHDILITGVSEWLVLDFWGYSALLFCLCIREQFEDNCCYYSKRLLCSAKI